MKKELRRQLKINVLRQQGLTYEERGEIIKQRKIESGLVKKKKFEFEPEKVYEAVASTSPSLTNKLTLWQKLWRRIKRWFTR